MKRGEKKNKKSHKLNQQRKQIVTADIVISLVIFSLLAVFRPDLLLIVSYILICIYLFLTARKLAFYHLFVSSLIAIIWVLLARNYYGYNQEMLVIFGINLFPLFSWAIGLFGVYMIQSYWECKLKEKNYIGRILLFLAFYWPLLILGETIAYYAFGIKDIATSMYPGLPLCNCLHAPIWMQISYFAIGPIYFLICNLLGLENPHKIKSL